MTNKTKFINSIKAGLCPFCSKKLKYHRGSLGYEANICNPCGLSIDREGINLIELEQNYKKEVLK